MGLFVLPSQGKAEILSATLDNRPILRHSGARYSRRRPPSVLVLILPNQEKM